MISAVVHLDALFLDLRKVRGIFGVIGDKLFCRALVLSAFTKPPLVAAEKWFADSISCAHIITTRCLLNTSSL